MLNQVVLIGRLTRDPELRYLGSGKPVANFTLAVERPFINKEGINEVDFISIVVWDKLAEVCCKHLGKGRMVAVSGRLQIRTNKKDDRSYINPEVVASEIRFLDWPKDEQEQREMDNEIFNEGELNVPF